MGLSEFLAHGRLGASYCRRKYVYTDYAIWVSGLHSIHGSKGRGEVLIMRVREGEDVKRGEDDFGGGDRDLENSFDLETN